MTRHARGRPRKSSDLTAERLADEVGTLYKSSAERVALTYPSPYHVGMSSLGFQTLYREINANSHRAAERAFLPDKGQATQVLRTYETRSDVSGFPVVALSVAYELELAGVIQVLELAGIHPLARERRRGDPFILAGGPLTFSNPLPLAPFVDAILLGEADETIHQVLDIIFQEADPRARLERLANEVTSCFVPSLHGDKLPSMGLCSKEKLPAYSQIRTPNTELRNMFLIEAERGCSRGCAYCVMRRSTNGGMRIVPAERILELTPKEAPRVGLVGAAVSDHPKIAQIVSTLADRGHGVGLSSLRPDRLTDEFVGALCKAGYKTLTTASDGSSQRVRNMLERRAKEKHLLRAAELARQHKMKRLKLYMMVGLPTEGDEDIDELVQFTTEISQLIPLSLGIAPFVAKRNTPLDRTPFAGIERVDYLLSRLRSGVKGRVDIRSTSARWAWVEYKLAQGGRAEGEAVLAAVKKGGMFRHWKDALDAASNSSPTRHLKVLDADRSGLTHAAS